MQRKAITENKIDTLKRATAKIPAAKDALSNSLMSCEELKLKESKESFRLCLVPRQLIENVGKRK